MSARRYAILTLVGASVAAPILIGTSCPPPSAPGIYSLVTDTLNATVLPPCNAGFVCVLFTNSTTIPATVSLYRHNGFDSSNKCSNTSSFQCCTNPNSQTACPCPCTGALTGECRLSRDDLFTGCSIDPPTANLDNINGATRVTLAPTQSVQKQIRCGDVKTLGASVYRNATDAQPADEVGPVYRDEPGGVRCGGTVQFLVVDLNQTTAGSGGQALVTLAIQPRFSQ
ncbi:MAG: hypothetical protein HRF43_05965 [Phycisphaerae bacterium]|jgi:hypothetical protein